MTIFHWKMRLWLKISICQSSMAHKGCWENCPTRVGNSGAGNNLKVEWHKMPQHEAFCCKYNLPLIASGNARGLPNKLRYL